MNGDGDALHQGIVQVVQEWERFAAGCATVWNREGLKGKASFASFRPFICQPNFLCFGWFEQRNQVLNSSIPKPRDLVGEPITASRGAQRLLTWPAKAHPLRPPKSIISVRRFRAVAHGYNIDGAPGKN
jgi:hypothetical protein